MKLNTSDHMSVVTIRLPNDVIRYIDKKTSARLKTRSSWIVEAIIDRLEKDRAISIPEMQAA